MAGVTPAANGEVRQAPPRMDRHDLSTPVAAPVRARVMGAGIGMIRPDNLPEFVGIALLAPAAAPSGEAMDIAFIRRDGTALPVGTVGDDEAIALWRDLSLRLRLPLMLETLPGRFEPVRPQLGPLLLGEIRIRRRTGLLSHRRPRFLTRRKVARLPLRPVVYR